MRDPNQPAVSVSIITYNQHHLIGRAIDSVLAQRTDFDYEIVIGDDCSSDGTQEVLREYARKYPDRIHLILHPVRYQGEVPGRTNNTTNLLNCRGRYTAMLDGDDYWTDPDKLQRQYDLMEENPHYSMCLHDAEMAYEDPPEPGEKRLKLMSEEHRACATGLYTHEDLAMRNRLHPFIGSIMYRTELLRELPEWFYSIVAADFALILHISQHGPVYYDARPAAAYYISRQGFQRVFRKNEAIMLQELRDIDTYNRAFPATRRNTMSSRGRARLNWHLSQHYRTTNAYPRALRHLGRMFRADPRFGLEIGRSILRKNFNRLRGQSPKRDSKSAEKSAAIRS